MKFKTKIMRVLSDEAVYMVGVNGDYIGKYSKKQLKEFKGLYLISIWVLEDRPGCICLDLVTEDVAYGIR